MALPAAVVRHQVGLVAVQQEACEGWRERLLGEVSQAGNPEALLYPPVLMRQWS